jgi:hypothetical protein
MRNISLAKRILKIIVKKIVFIKSIEEIKIVIIDSNYRR